MPTGAGCTPPPSLAGGGQCLPQEVHPQGKGDDGGQAGLGCWGGGPGVSQQCDAVGGGVPASQFWNLNDLAATLGWSTCQV